MNYSKGITWFDDCRIPFVDEVNFDTIIKQNKKDKTEWGIDKEYVKKHYKPEGRFPANLLVSDDMLNYTTKYYNIDKWFNKMIDELF